MILAVVGTRPEVIKMAPVIHALRRRGMTVQLATTGQHHDANMMGTFLESFDLVVDHSMLITQRDLLGSFIEILTGLRTILETSRPSLVLAQGDTTTVLATAFAARKLGILFGHVEAGLRAFCRELPEEEHRICADAVGDLLFAPTQIAADNLAREHVNGTVVMTGNSVLDALRMHPPPTVDASDRRGVLVTVHRQETVDDPVRLKQILFALAHISAKSPVLWPLHPRTQAKLAAFGLTVPDRVTTCGPLGHREFLAKLVAARIVVTDSGGVQEEAAILGTPCVCVRDNTERPETLLEGVGILAGSAAPAIVAAVQQIEDNWAAFARPVPHIYGTGNAGERIAAACELLIAENARATA